MSRATQAAARRFATALDAEDYPALAEVLSDECRFVTSRETLVGPEAIVASYRSASLWAKANIGHVHYESTVHEGAGGSAVVTFIDRLEHDGLTHTYACEQEVCVDVRERICRIVHRELPGQREAVETFLRRIGVRRNS